MVHHIRDVHKKIAEGSSDEKVRGWTVVQQRLEKQLLLRICSCCQIASKIHSNYHVCKAMNKWILFFAFYVGEIIDMHFGF